MQIFFILLFFILQTTALSMWSVKPDLFLFLLVLTAAGRGPNRGVLWGLGLGFFLDVFSAPFYLHVFIYGILGLLLGLIPLGYFRSYRGLAVSALLLATIFSQTVYGLVFSSVLKTLPGLGLGRFFLLLIFNGFLAYFLAEPLAKYFGVNAQAQ